ncbi:MAG: preprotein translocase subunit YajC [Nocardioidaceae bacterium]
MTQDDLYALLPFVLLALVFWFLVFRPARKRQRETQQTQASLEAGARVMLTSGIFGDVVSVDDTSVDVEIAPDTVVSVHRQAIGKVLPVEDPQVPDEDETTTTAVDDTDATDTDESDGTEDRSLPPTHQEKK